MSKTGMRRGAAAMGALAAVSCATTEKAAAPPRTVASFEDVGELGDGVESDIIGADAFQVLENGDLVVLDRVNGRLIRKSADGAETIYPMSDILLGWEVEAVDFRIAGRTLYIVTADGVIHAPAPPGLAPEAGVSLEATGAAEEDALADLQRSGRALSPRDQVVALESTADYCSSDDWESLSTQPWTDSKRGPDGRRLKVRFQRDGDTRLNVGFFARDGETPVAGTPIAGAATVANGYFIGLGGEGKPYLLVEFIAQTGTALAVTASVFRYALEGGRRYVAEARYDVPIADYKSLPRRYIEVTNEKVFLTGKKPRQAVSTVELSPVLLERRRQAPGPPRGPAAPAPAAPGGADQPGGVRLESTGSETTREEIMERAAEFAEMTWTLGATEYGPPADMTSKCASTSGAYWKRPGRLNGKQDREITAMPYRWGGWDTIDGFRDDTAKVAGDTCTEKVVPGTKGIDCSGFVTRAWAVPVSEKLGTSTLHTWSTAKQWKSLKCGDVLNLAGSHVRLFTRFVPDYGGSIEYYESSLDCGGVCREFTSAARFHGYVPRQYNNLEE